MHIYVQKDRAALAPALVLQTAALATECSLSVYFKCAVFIASQSFPVHHQALHMTSFSDLNQEIRK